jgi:predicted house-cleaning NTP pyrophosphatase (Maf/HAM1 superfamily)
MASRWAEGVDGCYFNVVGLPVSRVYRMLRLLEATTEIKIL